MTNQSLKRGHLRFEEQEKTRNDKLNEAVKAYVSMLSITQLVGELRPVGERSHVLCRLDLTSRRLLYSTSCTSFRVCMDLVACHYLTEEMGVCKTYKRLLLTRLWSTFERLDKFVTKICGSTIGLENMSTSL